MKNINVALNTFRIKPVIPFLYNGQAKGPGGYYLRPGRKPGHLFTKLFAKVARPARSLFSAWFGPPHAVIEKEVHVGANLINEAFAMHHRTHRKLMPFGRERRNICPVPYMHVNMACDSNHEAGAKLLPLKALMNNDIMNIKIQDLSA